MFQRTRFPAWAFLCVAGLVLLAALPVAAQVTITRQSEHNDVSPRLSELIANAPHSIGPVVREAEPARRIPLPTGLLQPGQEDSIRQQTTATRALKVWETAPLVSL